MSDPVFYIVELDLPDTELEDFLGWYANVHAPHLYEAGFTLCTSYRRVAGDMALIDIYQAPGPELFESPGFARYREVFAADPYRPAYIGPTRNTRTPYHAQPWDEPAGAAGQDLARPLAADWLTILRFPAGEGDLAGHAEWLRREGGPALRALGATHIRLLHKGAEAPTGGSTRPAGCLVAEWRREPGPGYQALLAARFPEAGAQDGFTGYRLYPWPDDVALRGRR